MRLLFFGMRGIFSQSAFQRLIASQHEILAVIVPAEDRRAAAPFAPLSPPPVDNSLDLPLLSSFVEQSIVQQAWEQRLPVYEVSKPGAPALLDWVSDLRVDAACVACFSRILPPALLNLPRHGFLNLHPSWLPTYRGPEPLFWQLRDGINPVGVTVHWMVEALDAGDIAAQKEVYLPDGVDWRSAERCCAETGGALLVDVLNQLEHDQFERHPQPGGGSYQPMPGVDDFSIRVEWSARRAFNFMRGTGFWGLPYRLLGIAEPSLLAEAVDWSITGGEPGRVDAEGELLRIGFAEGTLLARPYGSSTQKIHHEGRGEHRGEREK
jgi:methionyl-tRNA formyltransferase